MNSSNLKLANSKGFDAMPATSVMTVASCENGRNQPGGETIPVRGRAPEFLGGEITESEFILSLEHYIGPSYREIPLNSGRFVSADGLRQVRFGVHETRGPGIHGHFEAYDHPGGHVIENTRVEIVPDRNERTIDPLPLPSRVVSFADG